MPELARWTLTAGRFHVHGHNGYTADLVEKFPTRESAMAFARRLLTRRFDRVLVRDSMPTGDGPHRWILTREQPGQEQPA